MTNTFQSRKLPALVTALALWAGSGHAATLDGVPFADNVQLAGQQLRLNGLGLRRVLFIKAYAAALYLPGRADTLPVMNSLAGPKRLQLHMLHGADPDDFIEALLPGIRRNASPAQQAALAERLAQLEHNIRAIGHAAPGDVIDFDYLPDTGTVLAVNGHAKGVAIAGVDFYAAVLAIFVGEQPVDAGLKKGLLGMP